MSRGECRDCGRPPCWTNGDGSELCLRCVQAEAAGRRIEVTAAAAISLVIVIGVAVFVWVECLGGGS